MKILITGAGGFLGKTLAKTLQARGHKVINFSRTHHAELDSLGIVTVIGDLAIKRDIIRAVNGVDIVFHMASKVGMWGSYDDFYRTNVLGTQNLIAACKIHQVNKVIYTSSPSVIFGKSSLEGVDESCQYPKNYVSHYAKTKALAEQEMIKANNASFNTVCLRPHLIFGPDDPHIFPKLIDRAKSGKLKIIGNGENLVDIIYVQNAADAHVLAMDKLCDDSTKLKVAGKTFFLGQEEPVKLWEFINKILSEYGLKSVSTKVPALMAYIIGGCLEKMYSLMNIQSEPRMTRFVALQLSKSHYFNHQAASEILGYTPKIKIAEAIKLSVMKPILSESLDTHELEKNAN